MSFRPSPQPPPVVPGATAGAWSRPAWSARLLASLSLVLAMVAGQLPALAQQSAPLLREEASVPLPAPAAAVAINADESILAAALPEGLGAWRVQLFDRPSRGRLGALVAKVGPHPRLHFSPAADLLLVAGDEAVQLWELPIDSLNPDTTLSTEHRRWEVSLPAPPGDVGFGSPPSMVYWSAQGAVYRRSVEPGVPYEDEPAWRPAEGGAPVRALVFDPDSATAAVVFQDHKNLALLDLNGPQPLGDLAGHRFPVVAARYRAGRPLLSVDAGLNLAQWQAGGQPLAVTHLEGLPKDFRPTELELLGPRHVLLVGTDGRGIAVETRSARPAAEFRADGPAQVAVSPTGRYLLAGQGKALHLLGWGRPASPLDYVRRLRRMEAFTLAQSYVRLMDDTGLSSQLKGDLLNEAGREPPGQQLQNALERLRQSEQQGDADRIRYWAEQVLAFQPEHPDAVGALRRLRELNEAQAIRQAREAYNLGQHRLAISLLSGQVREESPHYPEALELIRKAEAGRAVETTLVQARERMDLGDFVAAEALVNEALRKDGDNPAALALADEIDDRSGATERQLLAAGIGGLLALLLVGFGVTRWRRKLGAAARKLRLDEDAPPRGAAWARRGENGTEGTAARRPSETVHEPRRPQEDRQPPRSANADAARRKVIEGLIKDTEERLSRLRVADLQGRHTARLMEMEAELSAIQRRVADPTAALGPLHTRLKEIDAQVRAVQADMPASGPGAAGTAGGAAGAGAGARRGTRNGSQSARSGAQEDDQEHAKGRAQGSGRRRAGQPAAPQAANDGAEPTHYEVLRLTPQATPSQIKTAYHQLIKEYHPDLHNASQFDWVKAESERMSRRIQEAYRILSDASARARYDRELRERGRRAR